MDLTKDLPRAANDRLIGIPMLPRTIDKARAKLAGTIGEYVYGDKSSFDRELLGFLELSESEFLDGVRVSPDDDAMIAWLRSHARTLSAADIDAFAVNFLSDGDDHADRARFQERIKEFPESVRPKIKGWADLLDAREGRIS